MLEIVGFKELQCIYKNEKGHSIFVCPSFYIWIVLKRETVLAIYSVCVVEQLVKAIATDIIEIIRKVAIKLKEKKYETTK